MFASRPGGHGAGLAAMVAATLLWGATFVILRDSVRALEPVTLVFLRFAAAAPLLAIGAWVARGRPNRAAWLGGAAGGVCAAGGYLFQAIGLQHTSAGTSAFLTNTGTLFAALFAWPLLGQRPSVVLLGGIALALLGSALLPTGGGFRLGPGEWWTLLGAVAFALQVVALGRFAPHAPALALAAVQATTTAVVLIPFVHAPAASLASLSSANGARLAYLVVAGSTVAPVLQILAQRSLAPGRIGLLFALEPVFALLFAITAGGERFSGAWWSGAALVLAGVGYVEADAFRRERRRRE